MSYPAYVEFLFAAIEEVVFVWGLESPMGPVAEFLSELLEKEFSK
jgi:hypothetical protein